MDVQGYTAWSLMDNLEWATGFAERFGLFYVNRTNPKLPRVAKASVSLYSTIINCNGFPDPALGPNDCINPTPEGKQTQIWFSIWLKDYFFLGREATSVHCEVARQPSE